MTLKKTKFEFAAKLVGGILLLVILFLIALNGRYSHMHSKFYLDKWKKHICYINNEGKLVKSQDFE